MKQLLPSRARFGFAVSVAALLACNDPTSSPVERTSSRADAKIDASAYTVTDLGTFGIGAGPVGLDIDKHGEIFGRFTRAAGGPGSFSWTEKDGFVDLGDFDGRPFLILSTNDHRMLSGSTVTFGSPNVLRAAAFLPETGFVYLDGTNSGNSGASNDKGQIPGTRFGSGTSWGWVWSEETGAQLIPITLPGRTINSYGASAINKDGTAAGVVTSIVTGGLPNTRTIRGYIWDEVNGTTVLPTIGPTGTGPGGPANVGVTYISNEGLVLGATEMTLATAPGPRPSPVAAFPGTISAHAWKWSPSLGIVDLGTLGGRHSVAWNADKDGNVYGWASDVTGRKHAVKWVAGGGIIDLGSLGGDAVTGGLNKHGVVVGWAIGSDSRQHVVRYDPTK